MPNLPSFKPREIEKILLANKFYIKRQSGSHRVYCHIETNAVVIVPFHSRDIPTGTLRSIIRQSKLPLEKFMKN